MSKRAGDSLRAYEAGGFREKYAMDNGNKAKSIDHRGHEMWKFTYNDHREYQDANGALWDNTEKRWVN